MKMMMSGALHALAQLQRRHAMQMGLLAAGALSCVANAVAAPSITSAPPSSALHAVPASDVWAIAAAALAVIALAAHALRKRHGRFLVLVAVLAVGALWNSATPWAQILGQFTQRAGQTLPIPVVPVVASGVLQGFEPADFMNAAGGELRIAAITPPDFDTCFPVFPTAPLPPAGGDGPAACAVGQALAAGASCRVDVDAICKALAVQATAVIGISPASLVLAQNGSATVTVQVDPASPQPAHNVAAAIPGGSALAVQSSTCPASLAAGAACEITFTSPVLEGPTTVTVAGSNTAATPLAMTVVARPVIAITAPAQASRIITVGSTTALALTVTNDAGSPINASNITVIDQAAAPDVVVDASDCTSVAPGASCTLRLTSSTPYAPATLTVGGANTANTPTALLAFAHLGGLVFEASGGAGKVVTDAAQQFVSQWTATTDHDIAGSRSSDDGAANTAAIVADADCADTPGQCAARRCRDLGEDWYLPAINEMQSILGALCPGGAGCNFGGITPNYYSSSTQTSVFGIRVMYMSSGQVAVSGKVNAFPVRCVRAFTP